MFEEWLKGQWGWSIMSIRGIGDSAREVSRGLIIRTLKAIKMTLDFKCKSLGRGGQNIIENRVVLSWEDGDFGA